MEQTPSHKELNRLLEAWLAGETSPAENAFLEQYFAWFEGKPAVMDQLDPAERQVMIERVAGRIAAETNHEEPAILPAQVHHVHFIRKYRWTAAAAIFVLAAGLSVLTYLNRGHDRAITAKAVNVPAPDKSKAIIVLGGGDSINLASIPGGRYVTQEGLVITRMADGEIQYSGALSGKTLAYHTSINPKGSTKMHLRLTDGTEIWLNAGSSITYPLVFKEATRKATLNGEAYLEVAHDSQHPFIVSKGNTSVTVLGTQFNVKAYDNDPSIKVTLLEGSVRVQKENATQVLKPNEQAVVKDNSIQLVQDADTNEAMAWFNGRTSFHDIGLQEAFKELERWYDVTIVASGANLPEKQLYMDLERGRPLQDVLKSILEANGVQFSYDSEKRIVTIQ